MTDQGPGPSHADPVRAKRARLAHASKLAQRIGYALFGLAVVAFFIGFFSGFTGAIVTIIVVLMAVGSVLLAPAIVLSYAVKAAERDDIEHGR